MSNIDADELFAAVRRQFMEDPEGNLERLRELSGGFTRDPAGALTEAAHIFHNLKGSAQAVGFAFLAAQLHAVEDVLGRPGGVIDAFFSRLIAEIEAYFVQLAASLEDRAEFAKGCEALLQGVETPPPSPSLDLASVAVDPQGWELFGDTCEGEDDWGAEDETAQHAEDVAEAGWGLFTAKEASMATAVPPEAPLAPAAAAAPPETARPPAPAAPNDETGESSGKYLLLEQASRLFAIALSEVREIISHHYLNPLPESRPGLKGMIVVRDRTLPVVDLGSVFGEAASAGGQSCAVICESRSQSFAFSVEKPRQVVTLAPTDFEAISDKFGEHVHQGLVKSVATIDGRSVLVVDLTMMLGR